LEPCLGVLVIGVGSVGSWVGGGKACPVASLLVVGMAQLHGAPVTGEEGGVPVPPSQHSIAMMVLGSGDVVKIVIDGMLNGGVVGGIVDPYDVCGRVSIWCHGNMG